MIRRKSIIAIAPAAILFLSVCDAQAYIGPGAGFALASSFFFLFIAFILAFLTIVSFPIRSTVLFFRRRLYRKHSKVRRVVIIGFDGMDPELCRRYFEKDKLPHLQRLSAEGSFSPLKTTTPAISPVAWSSFSTGVNPGKHNIFDFFTRNLRNYLPIISSTHISTVRRKLLPGPFPIFISSVVVRLLRKSIPFWKLLGDKKIFSVILRVPITFPPEKFYGVCLSAMCAPDLAGTQGRYSHFTSAVRSGDPENTATDVDSEAKGLIVPLKIEGDCFKSTISGPTVRNGEKEIALIIPLEGRVDYDQNKVRLTLIKETVDLKKGVYSPWIKLEFKMGIRKRISGIVRFLLTSVEPELKIYMTPINIDPEKPNLPISHPRHYSIALSKINGPFSTLGLAEDTNALDDEVIDDAGFLTQAYDIYKERKRIFLDNLKKTREGLLISVFDTTDRIQHMFFRYLDQEYRTNNKERVEKRQDPIEELYIKMDQLVGEVQKRIKRDDLLLIISDHGFKPFKWGVNLNTWLWQEGYLVTKGGVLSDKKWFADIDWRQTKAYALGLAGIYVNTKGREHKGVVKPGSEKESLLKELQEKLEGIYDQNNDCRPIRRVLLASKELTGPYLDNAPDVIMGYEAGYRASWDCAVGKITDKIIEDNARNWSGDHCIDPELVPGVFFSNWKLNGKSPALVDLAPTVLDMFGLKKQKFHDGKILELTPPG